MKLGLHTRSLGKRAKARQVATELYQKKLAQWGLYPIMGGRASNHIAPVQPIDWHGSCFKRPDMLESLIRKKLPKAVREAAKASDLAVLASLTRTECAAFLTGEVEPKDFVKHLHDLAYRCQHVLKEQRVKAISPYTVAYSAVPNIDPNRIATDAAIEFIKAHRLTLPAKGFWRLLHDTNSKGEQKYGRSRGLDHTAGMRTVTNGVDLAILRGDGTFFWGTMDAWVFDEPVRNGGRVSRAKREEAECHEVFV